MAALIGVSGLCGSGKSTAIEHLRKLCPGQVVYLGGMVLREVERRGLAPTPENELTVQTEIRAEHGPIALAVLATPIVSKHLQQGLNVIVDAIFNPEEFSHFQNSCPRCTSVTLAIHTSFHFRCDRLAKRKERPLSRDQILARDTNEVMNLGASRAITLARHHLVNNGSLESFELALAEFWKFVRD